MRTKIYTKGGDKGETSLFGGPRVSKSNLQLEAYGTVDELSAAIGMCLSLINNALNPTDHGLVKNLSSLKNIYTTLEITQNELFNIGSHLACAEESLKKKLPKISAELTLDLETQIDSMSAELPELRDFILPGGHPISALLHLARTICRRAERNTVGLIKALPNIDAAESEQIISCLNRLSDYLFIAARFVNHIHNIDEVKWKK